VHYEPTLGNAIKHVAVNLGLTLGYAVIFGSFALLWIGTPA